MSFGRTLGRLLGASPLARAEDSETAALVRQGEEAYGGGRREDARRLFRQALERRRHDPGALRGLRRLAVDAGAWPEALSLAERTMAAVPANERSREAEWLAGIHYELGRAEMQRGQPAAATAHFRGALKADRAFLPAALALGEAHEAAGDHREAVKAWEQATERLPALPLLTFYFTITTEQGASRLIFWVVLPMIRPQMFECPTKPITSRSNPPSLAKLTMVSASCPGLTTVSSSMP